MLTRKTGRRVPSLIDGLVITAVIASSPAFSDPITPMGAGVGAAGAVTKSVAQDFKSSCANLYSAIAHTGLAPSVARKSLNEAKIYNSAPDEFMPTPEDAPWAANYFPMMDGGIANRWQSVEGKYDFINKGEGEIPLPKAETLEKIKDMTRTELDQLSPAEKYDILMRDYGFGSTRWEFRHRGPKRVPKPQGWEGYCNAMRAAGCLVPEPVKSIVVKNADGIELTMEPADIKALIGSTHFYVEKYAALATPHMGKGLDDFAPNAAGLHAALNHLAIKGKFPMVIDMENKGYQLWNETVVGYKRSMSNPRNLSSAERVKIGNKATRTVDVQLELRALAEIDMNDTNGATKAAVAAGEMGINKLDYKYKLYLDDEDVMVGGEWVGKDWPDFIWFPNGRGADIDYDGNPSLDYDAIMKLVKKSAKE